MRARILLLHWRAWHLRNDCIHHDGKATIVESVSFLKAYLQEPYIQVCVHTDVKGKQALYPATTSSTSSAAKPQSLESWSTPPAGWIKLNTDCSFFTENITAGEVLDAVLLAKFRELC
jgi:hypothetical protein